MSTLEMIRIPSPSQPLNVITGEQPASHEVQEGFATSLEKSHTKRTLLQGVRVPSMVPAAFSSIRSSIASKVLWNSGTRSWLASHVFTGLELNATARDKAFPQFHVASVLSRFHGSGACSGAKFFNSGVLTRLTLSLL